MILKLYEINSLKKHLKSKFTIKIVDKVIIPYFKNTNMSLRTIKIENILQKVFPKHIKNNENRIRFFKPILLKLNHWNINMKKRKITQVFERAWYDLMQKIIF